MLFLAHGLTILFVGLRLTDSIDWSWFYVLLPSILAISILPVSIIVFAVRYPIFVWQNRFYHRVRRWLEDRGWRKPKTRRF